MRVLLVGTPEDRARLRASLNGSLRVAGEFPTLAAADASGIEADGILLAHGVRPPPSRLRRFGGQGKPDTTYDSQQPDTMFGENDETLQEPLTAREIQVLELLAEGLPNKAIAERLQISDQTVKFHVASISGKLGAANRTDAVRRAVRRGLITL
jgi:ATP/maltotriose-dependent transcriptional regulator MalT